MNMLKNILSALYMYLPLSVILAVLVMFTYLYFKKTGIKAAVTDWITSYRSDVGFRHKTWFAFYTSMILCKTLLCRSLGANPLGDIWGKWYVVSQSGEVNTDNAENFLLFVPFMYLMLWCWESTLKAKSRSSRILFAIRVLLIPFLFSLFIETCQLFFKLGTFQISDLFFNTMGGFCGIAIYYIVKKNQMPQS